jgi:hypothetical protein
MDMKQFYEARWVKFDATVHGSSESKWPNCGVPVLEIFRPNIAGSLYELITQTLPAPIIGLGIKRAVMYLTGGLMFEFEDSSGSYRMGWVVLEKIPDKNLSPSYTEHNPAEAS